MKKILFFATTLSVLMASFVACGGDSGTSSAGSPTEPAESSSSVIPSEESSSSKDDDSSSSVIPSGGSAGVEGSSGSSSSSANVTPNSSSVVLGSSSSVTPSDGSSSSVGGVSSSSVASSSSSASVVPSSSSAEESSSSVYVPYNHYKDLAAEWKVGEGAYKTFVDPRNNREYYYLTITGKDTSKSPNSVTVMAENLNIGKLVESVEDQEDDSVIERYCHKEDTTMCDKYGGLYQWAEMMQLPSECNSKSCADQIQPDHQGICPDGWRLLNYNDMYTIVHCDNCTHGIEDVRSNAFGGYNYSGFSLIGAGYNWDHKFGRLGQTTNWFYPEEDDEYADRAVASGSSSHGTDFSRTPYDKINGYSVRCVKLDE